MATSAEELTECIVCFETFRDPQLLTCHHTFCKHCVDKIADAGTIQCPTCKKVSLIDDVKPDFRLEKFLDALALQIEALTTGRTEICKETTDVAEAHKKLCDLCEDKVATHWCKDCKQWICDHCKQIHEKASATKLHSIFTIQATNEQRKIVIDKVLDKMTDKVCTYQNLIDQFEDCKAQVVSYQDEVISHCKTMRTQCHQEVDRQFDGLEERVKAMISPDADKVQKVHADTQAKLQELKRQKRDLEQALADIEAGLVSNDVTVEEMKAALKTMKAPDFSMQLQRVRLKPQKTTPASVKPTRCEVLKSSWCGVNNFRSLLQGIWKKQVEVKLPICPLNIRYIKQQLWCCCGRDGIVVLDTDLQQQKTIPAGGMLLLYDVAVTNNGDVIIAAKNGLYRLRTTGQFDARQKIENGCFTSVAIYQGRLYATEVSSAETLVYRIENDAWKKQYFFLLPLRNVGELMAPILEISVKCDRVTYSSSLDNQIMHYSLTGELLTSHDKQRTADAGESNFTFICDGDDDGSVLVADSKDDQLYVMNERGEYSAMQLEPTTKQPRSALVVNGSVFVASFNKSLRKYSCKQE